MSKTKIAFQTFGCKLNFSETSGISKLFDKDNFEIVDSKGVSDVYVINTCSVTGAAEHKCKQAIRQVKRRNPLAIVAVMGCFSQLKPEEIKTMEGVDLILGNEEKFQLPEYLKSLKKNTEPVVAAREILKSEIFSSSYSSGDRTRSFLKIQDGCDYFCSYCTIPFARGKSRSDKIENTLNLAREIIKTGIREIILTGVNIGDFGRKHGESLFNLLVALENVEGIDRIRISSIEPDLLSDEILDLVVNSKKILPHFHIPLQSGNNRILNAMNRKYSRELFADRVIGIKSRMPQACIAADVIVGFPGETEEEFQDSCAFIEDLDISYIHVFSYSDRENTRASKMNDKIRGNIIKERSRRLHLISDQKKLHFYRQNFGKTFSVLFESSNIDGYIYGWTENYIHVKTYFNPEFVNEIKKVTLSKLSSKSVYIWSGKEE